MHKTGNSCLEVARELREINNDIAKEKEEDKLRYITRKLTLINERISMHKNEDK